MSPKTGRAPRFPTWRYGQRLVWRGRDDWGVVEVVKNKLGYSLHFGSAALQGRIHHTYPWLPVAEYVHSMAAAAAFPAPQQREKSPKDLFPIPTVPQVCLLGMGTGSLAWTYQHLLPHAKLTAIELRPAVIELATQLLSLSDLKQLTILQGDALLKLQELPDHSQTLVAVDLFMADGMAKCLLQQEFWEQVKRVLHPIGVVCVNSWSSKVELFKTIIHFLEQLYPQNPLMSVDHITFGNVILFATPRSVDRIGLLKRAQLIDEKLSLSRLDSKKAKRLWTKEAPELGLTGESVYERLSRAQEPVTYE